MKCCVSTDVGAWTNWLTFEPDPDYSPDAGIRLFSLISYAMQRRILLRLEFPTYRYWVLVAAAMRGFKMFFHREPWEQLCRRYMCTTECLLVTRIKLLKLLFINWHFFRSFHSFELLFNSNTLQFCFCVLLFHHCLLYCNINVDIIILIIIINTALIKVTLSCHIAGALYKIRQKKTNKGTEEVLMLIVRSREQYCHCLCRTAIKTIVLFVCFLYRAVF